MWAEPWLLPAALALEACVGYPARLYNRISHPVVWIGRLIVLLERLWNRAACRDAVRRTLGVIAMIIVVALAVSISYALQTWLLRREFGWVLLIVLATTGLAQRSLYAHVRDVLRALLADDLSTARSAVAQIVGRDTQALNKSDVATAAIESLAESFNDGVVAPAFWLCVGGLPGLYAYKAINTADSLIGHKEPRWRAYGWAAARIDDLVNLLPARLAGLLLVIAGGGGFAVMRCDAPKHASPNAGWPEAAMAGALRIRIGGAASYDGVLIERPEFGNGPCAAASDLAKGLRIYTRACALLWLIGLMVAISMPLAGN